MENKKYAPSSFVPGTFLPNFEPIGQLLLLTPFRSFRAQGRLENLIEKYKRSLYLGALRVYFYQISCRLDNFYFWTLFVIFDFGGYSKLLIEKQRVSALIGSLGRSPGRVEARFYQISCRLGDFYFSDPISEFLIEKLSSQALSGMFKKYSYQIWFQTDDFYFLSLKAWEVNRSFYFLKSDNMLSSCSAREIFYQIWRRSNSYYYLSLSTCIGALLSLGAFNLCIRKFVLFDFSKIEQLLLSELFRELQSFTVGAFN